MSIHESVFPSIWKKSLVLALNKIAMPHSLSAFRPVTLLCFISNILEKLIHNQMHNYIETRQLLDFYQSGYRTCHSTQMALIKFADDIRVGMDRKHATMLLLLDFSRTFDPVCYVTLIRTYVLLIFLVQP